jgi:hypothetical protein
VPFLLVVSMLAVGGIVGLLLFTTSMQQASFAATDLQRQADVLEAQQQTLQMQLASLRDPQTIALKAQRMGMVLPTGPAVLDLRTGKVLGQPAPATRTDPLRLLAPPPAKPAELDPPAHVTVVPAPGRSAGHSSGHSHHHGANAGRGAHARGGSTGSNGTTSHNNHANTTGSTAGH